MYSKYETVTHDGYSIVDNITGELHEFKQVKKVSYDDFILVFLSSIPEMMNLNGSLIKMLMLLWKKSTFNPGCSTEGNYVYNDILFKDFVRHNGLDISNSAIDVYLNRLVKLGFIIRKCKGCYLLNPRYFFKGTVKDAAKMSLTIELAHEEEQ